MIRFSGFVEPLLDKKIFNHISTFKKSLPKVRVEVVTNDPLNLNRLKKLFDCGLDKILISAYDGYEDVIKFQKLVDECSLNETQYIIR